MGMKHWMFCRCAIDEGALKGLDGDSLRWVIGRMPRTTRRMQARLFELGSCAAWVLMADKSVHAPVGGRGLRVVCGCGRGCAGVCG